MRGFEYVNVWMLALALGGCSEQWDSAAPAIELVGTEPAPGALPRLNETPAGHSTLMQGAGPGYAPWAAFCSFWSGTGLGPRGCKRWRMVRVDDRAAVDEV